MKIRTDSQLFACIDDDLIWRKRELTQFKFLLQDTKKRRDKNIALLRSAVPLLYAHWEGFIKAAAKNYLEFVASQRLKINELSVNFIALSARKILLEASCSKKIKQHIALTDFFRNGLQDKSSLPYKDAINTRANLSSDVLREIIEILGLDYSPYETKAHIIDEKLLKFRNMIAHGEYLSIEIGDYETLNQQVIEMMDDFKTQIQNATLLSGYKSKSC